MTNVSKCTTIGQMEEGGQMEVREENVMQIVREETAKWLASIWRTPDPDIEFVAGDGIDPHDYAPSQSRSTVSTLKSSTNMTVEAHGSVEIDTGVSIVVPKRTCAIVLPDNNLNMAACMVAHAVFGEGDTGRIRLRLYNFGEYDYDVRNGQPIASMIIVPAISPNYVLSEVCNA